MTLVSVTAYHSFSGEVEASNTPTIRRLTPSCRHQLPRIAPPHSPGPSIGGSGDAIARALSCVWQVDSSVRASLMAGEVGRGRGSGTGWVTMAAVAIRTTVAHASFTDWNSRY